jgi:hypothetical protein
MLGEREVTYAWSARRVVGVWKTSSLMQTFATVIEVTLKILDF